MYNILCIADKITVLDAPRSFTSPLIICDQKHFIMFSILLN